MPNVLAPENVTNQAVTSVLDDAAIEHCENTGLYVTDFKFNFWIDVDQERKLIFLYSHCQVQPDADELDVLKFCNKANSTKIMLQIYYSAKRGNVYAYYSLPFHAGLITQHLLKLCRIYSDILSDIMENGIEEGVLMPLPECPSDDAEGGSVDATSDSTVH